MSQKLSVSTCNVQHTPILFHAVCNSNSEQRLSYTPFVALTLTHHPTPSLSIFHPPYINPPQPPPKPNQAHHPSTPHNPLPPLPPVPIPGTSASLAPSCAFISRSCSTICCSSTMHTANGTLSIIAPVISTQSPLPPTQAPCFETATVELSVLVRKRRVFGGTMSRRARRLRRGGVWLERVGRGGKGGEGEGTGL